MTSVVRHVIALLALAASVRCLLCDQSSASGEWILFDCSSRNISRIPSDIPNCTMELHLEKNNITTLPAESFRTLSKLVVLDLSHNHINHLETRCFVGLTQLRKLNLHGNDLDLVRLSKGTFAGLPSLRILAIAGQGTIGQYPVAILEGLTELHTLSVRGEHTHFPEVYGRLPHLTTLDVNGGEIRRVTGDMFSAIRDSNITQLVIRGTNINVIEAGSFSNFANLRLLNFTCNRNLTIRHAISSLGQTQNSGIDTVILDVMKTRTINLLDFQDFCSDTTFWKRIRRVSLRHNGLRAVVVRNIQCLSELEEFYASHNAVRLGSFPANEDMHTFSSRFRKLRVVDISYNANLDSELMDERCRNGFDSNFDTNEDLLSLHESQPVAHAVSRTALQTPDPVDYTNAKRFTLPTNLRYIDGSQITSSGRDSWSSQYFFNTDNNLVYLNLSGTKSVRHLNCLVVGLTKLQVLDTSHGFLHSLGDELFRYMPSLRVLNLSNNALGKGQTNYQKVFSFTQRLEDIDLSNNGIRHIHPKTFSMCKHVKLLKLKNNEFYDINLDLNGLTSLRLIDLRSNRLPFLRSAFTDQLDNVYYNTFQLDIRNNYFVCSCDSLPFIRWLQATPIRVTGKASLSCLYNDSPELLINISALELQKSCESQKNHVWVITLVFGILLLMVLLYVLNDFVKFKLLQCKTRLMFAYASQSRTMIKYQVAVLFDTEDDEWRNWVEEKLIPKLDEYRVIRFIMGRSDWASNSSSELESRVAAIDQSEKVIVCLTEMPHDKSEFGQVLRFARYSNKHSNDYIIISRGNQFIIPDLSSRRRWSRAPPQSARIDRDALDEDDEWDILLSELRNNDAEDSTMLHSHRSTTDI